MYGLSTNLDRPIQTYSGRGVSKEGVLKYEHCIIYTGSEPPPLEVELPIIIDEDGTIERGMLESIKVNPAFRGGRMDPMSRLNFAKVYTVEHNVKVAEFGDVSPDSLVILKHQFYRVWHADEGN